MHSSESDHDLNNLHLLNSSPAAWLSPPAASPWLLSAEPSSADHRETCLGAACPEAPCPCACWAEGALQASCSWVGSCPYQEASEAWAWWACEASLAPGAAEEEDVKSRYNYSCLFEHESSF